jgi:CAAX prenyl protease-like protein
LPWVTGVAILTTGAWLLATALEGSGKSDGIVPTFAGAGSGQLVGVAWWFLRITGTVLVVPLAEELAFRGFVIRRLTSPDVEHVLWANITPFALVAQAILFGVLHPHHMLGGILAGLAFGWLGRHTRCGLAPVLAHALTNALVLVSAAATGRWDWL